MAPADELCYGIEDEISSDATVLYQDSEPEEETHSFVQAPNRQLREARHRDNQQYPVRTINMQPAFDSYTAVPGMHMPRHPEWRMSGDAYPREHFRPRRGLSLSWGYQQELADYEAAHLSSARGLMCHNPNPGGYVIRNDLQPPTVIQHNRSRGRNDSTGDINNEGMGRQSGSNRGESREPTKTKSRRRGRRGGRGRKNADRPADVVVPRLEKNLEDELAEEMANHISSKSALAQSYSSLRLHVAGGGTMIILNDKEIVNNERLRDDSSLDSARKGRDRRRDPYDDHRASSRPRGCGAYFPPQILKQLQGEVSTGRSTSSYHSRFNSGADYPQSSTHGKSIDQQSHGNFGTGCFIPAYSQDATLPEVEPSSMLEGGSLAESWACLENSESLLDGSLVAETETGEIFCSDTSTPILDKPKYSQADDSSPVGSSTNDVIQLIENEDYKTFTSPLHLDDTLDGLRAEREASEMNKQRLINLEIENEELRSALKSNTELEAKVKEWQEFSLVLQSMLVMEMKKNRKYNVSKTSPSGLSLRKSPVESSKGKKEERAKRPKSALKKSVEVKKPVKSDKRVIKGEQVLKQSTLQGGKVQSGPNTELFREESLKKPKKSSKGTVRLTRPTSSFRP